MYDALAESVRLLQAGIPDVPTRLSRHQPIAFDVDGDVAVTEFLARCRGGASWDSWTLHRRDGVWTRLGGGASSAHPYDQLCRPPDIDASPEHLVVHGGGWTHLGHGRRGGVSYARLEISTAVAAVSVDGRRQLFLPWHRRPVVVWRGRRTPRLRALGGDGSVLTEVRPAGRVTPGRARRAGGRQVARLVSRA